MDAAVGKLVAFVGEVLIIEWGVVALVVGVVALGALLDGEALGATSGATFYWMVEEFLCSMQHARRAGIREVVAARFAAVMAWRRVYPPTGGARASFVHAFHIHSRPA